MTIPWGWIVSGATALFGFMIWFLKLSIERSLDKRDKQKSQDERRKEDQARRKEEEARRIAAEQAELTKKIIRGLYILSECDYELIYALKNGEHNGGIDSCMKEITAYRNEIKDYVFSNAAKN